nr:SDR family NAD(P)-dependent oxidoreductase [Agrobacterium tumefaciens]
MSCRQSRALEAATGGPSFRQCRAGVIINVTSAVTLKPSPLIGVSGASTPAVEAFTKSLAIELAPFGVRTHIIQPRRLPETRSGDNARPHLCYLSEPDYAAIIKRFVASVREGSGPVTHVPEVAEAIWCAASDP